MRTMSAERLRSISAEGRKADGPSPGPSRLRYRLHRAWKKAWVRHAVLFVLPFMVLLAVGVRMAADPALHARIHTLKEDLVLRLSARPEFLVQTVQVTGASPDIERAVLETARFAPGMSSLTLNVADMKPRIETLGAVKSAHVTLGSDGVLRIHVIERIPAALWRDADDKLWLIDREGAKIARAITRLGYPDLPLVLGEGAPVAVSEALGLLVAGRELRPRIRAVVRVGERRWNLVLDRDLTIMLPEDRPVAALSRVIAWHYGEEALDRGLAVIDMRLQGRPTLRMHPETLEVYRVRKAAGEIGEDT